MFLNILAVQEKPVLVIKRFLQLLDVRVTDTTVQTTLLNHPDYPSLLSLSDALHAWNVNTLATRIPKEQLLQLPLPVIAHIYAKKEENFVLVTKADDDNVRYHIDAKEIISPTKDFLQAWSGVALLAEQGKASGEKNYTENRRKEKWASLKVPAVLLFAILFMAAAIMSFYNDAAVTTFIGYALLLLVKLAGVVVTSLLLWYEIDKANPALQKICTAGAKTNCNAILSSKQAKVFNWLSWSEVGFFYFMSGLVSLLLIDLTSSIFLLLVVTLLNVFALPYTMFSLYYQWRIAKQWCLLCLSVQALLLVEFITSFSTSLLSASLTQLSNNPTSLFNALFSFFVTIIVIATGWFLLKPLFVKAEEAKRTKRELTKLKASPQIWEALLAKQKQITIPTNGLGITLGNPAATNTLIKICNPYCGPCTKAHLEIEKLLAEHDNLKVQILFTATNEENDYKAPPVKHLLAIADKKDETFTKLALDDWYLADKKDYEAFAGKYPVNGELKQQNAKVEAMRTWCDETKIAFTPTIFFNGYQLPEIYNLQDIQYFLQ